MAENMRQKVKSEPEAETLRKKARTEPSSSSCPPRFSMKLLIDNGGKRVLFAEAGKDCVDFLFYILSLPVSTLIRLVGKQGMTGSVANLYESVETLDGSFVLENVQKDSLLKLPITPRFCGYNNIPGSATQASTEKKILYRCQRAHGAGLYVNGYNNTFGQGTPLHCGSYISDSPRETCPVCTNLMSKGTFLYVAPAQGVGGGFVKDAVKFVVMDDLVVKPITSVMTSINLITQLGVKNVSQLEEKVVVLGIDEGVKLLKASLVSKNVLTSVFFNASGKN